MPTLRDQFLWFGLSILFQSREGQLGDQNRLPSTECCHHPLHPLALAESLRLRHESPCTLPQMKTLFRDGSHEYLMVSRLAHAITYTDHFRQCWGVSAAHPQRTLEFDPRLSTEKARRAYFDSHYHCEIENLRSSA